MDDAAGDHRAERPPRVLADPNRAVQAVEAVLVRRVDANVGVVEGPWRDPRLVADGAPACAPVVRAKEFAALRFHQGVDHLRVGSRHRHADAAQLALRQPVFRPELRPVLARVVRDEEAAPRPSRAEEPRPPPERPHRRKQLVRVGRVHDQIGHPRPRVHVQHALPGLAPVRRLVHAPLLPVAPGRPHRAHVHGPRIVRMNHHAVNPLRLLQSHAPPRVAPVQTPVHPGADPRRVARIPLARPHPDHVRIGRRHRHRPDPEHRLLIEDRMPGEPPVARPPDAPRRGPDVHDGRVVQVDRHGRDPPAHSGRPDAPRLHDGEVGRSDGRLGLRNGGTGRGRERGCGRGCEREERGRSEREEGQGEEAKGESDVVHGGGVEVGEGNGGAKSIYCWRDTPGVGVDDGAKSV